MATHHKNLVINDSTPMEVEVIDKKKLRENWLLIIKTIVLIIENWLLIIKTIVLIMVPFLWDYELGKYLDKNNGDFGGILVIVSLFSVLILILVILVTDEKLKISQPKESFVILFKNVLLYELLSHIIGYLVLKIMLSLLNPIWDIKKCSIFTFLTGNIIICIGASIYLLLYKAYQFIVPKKTITLTNRDLSH